MPEVEKAFQDMKQCIAELPMVTAPRPKEELIIYLCAAKEAVSAVLLTVRDSRQLPIYFISHALQVSKINYSSMEKLVLLALVHASRMLRRYFQAHPIAVITDQAIKQILPRTSIHGQVLANFIAERPDEDGPLYEALVAGLRIAEQMGVQNLEAKIDSRCREAKIRRQMRKRGLSHCGRGGVLLDDTTARIPHGRYPTSGNKKGMDNQNQSKAVCRDQWTSSIVAKAIRSGYCWPTDVEVMKTSHETLQSPRQCT
ncbi:reverse transcriptase domain-containing protein [Tanacetum coccineum]